LIKCTSKFRVNNRDTYKKIVKRTKKYAVHVPENNVKEGDVVDIIESVPVSKTKKWQIFAGI
jgi:small subunit ribosomal protein S17